MRRSISTSRGRLLPRYGQCQVALGLARSPVRVYPFLAFGSLSHSRLLTVSQHLRRGWDGLVRRPRCCIGRERAQSAPRGPLTHCGDACFSDAEELVGWRPFLVRDHRMSNDIADSRLASFARVGHGALSVSRIGCYLVDPASSHMLVSKIKPCMCKYEQIQTVKLRMAH